MRIPPLCFAPQNRTVSSRFRGVPSEELVEGRHTEPTPASIHTDRTGKTSSLVQDGLPPAAPCRWRLSTRSAVRNTGGLSIAHATIKRRVRDRRVIRSDLRSEPIPCRSTRVCAAASGPGSCSSFLLTKPETLLPWHGAQVKRDPWLMTRRSSAADLMAETTRSMVVDQA
jgi:hypothetical protein